MSDPLINRAFDPEHPDGAAGNAGPTATAAPSRMPSPRRVAVTGARLLVGGIYVYVLLTTVVLVLGFLLLLFGANSDASFVAWAYRSMERAMEPFRGMFTPIDLGAGAGGEVGAVLDTSLLFAILVYAIAAWLVGALLGWVGDFLASITAADTHHP